MDGYDEDIAQITWLVTWEELFGEDTDITFEHDIAADEFAEQMWERLKGYFPNAEIFCYADAAQYAQLHTRFYANDEVSWDRIQAAYDTALNSQWDLLDSEWWAKRQAQIEYVMKEEVA